MLFGYFGCIFVNATRFCLDFSEIKDYPFHFLNILLSSIHSLSLVLIKYMMTKYVLLSPYFFLLYDGIFNIFNSILLILLQYIIITNLPDQNKNITSSKENDKYFSNNFYQIIEILIGQKSQFYIYFFLSFIFSFFYYILYTLVIFNNSPFLIILIEAFLPLDNDIIKIIFKSKEDYIKSNKGHILERFYYQSIGYLFLFFGALIINEIIVFNFWGLNQYTSTKMTERESRESDANNFTLLELTNTDDTQNNEEIED